MSETDIIKLRRHLAVLQAPLPFSEKPFAVYAEKLGISEDEVIELLQKYLADGTIRRIAGVLKHNRAGFTVNGMVALEVALDKCDETGTMLAQFPFITHCYRRTAYPDWPYTIYAMVHAKSNEEFEHHLDRIRSSVTYTSLKVLHSLKEYKKTAFKI